MKQPSPEPKHGDFTKHIMRREEADPIAEKDAIIERLEAELSMALAKQNALEREAGIDTLTGVANRKFLEPRLEKILIQLTSPEARHSAKAGVLVFMLDLKGLKAINEAEGHRVAGDKALKDFANLLRSTVRDEDKIFRYGGDEFVVLELIENKAAGQELNDVFGSVIKRMESAVGDLAYVGYSELRRGEEGVTAETLLESADEMLLQQKALKKSSKKS